MPEAGLLLEIVTDSTEGLHTAVANGADRIELCAALSVGGVTPGAGLMRFAAGLDCPVRAMIRPRAGDFTYSLDDIEVMRRDIDLAKVCGVKGVVFGANRPDGAFDEVALGRLAMHARGLDLDIALHRSFDLTPEPLIALDIAMALGFDTVLTSGGARTARDGVEGLARLVEHARGRIEVLAGIGVTAHNAADIVLMSGVRSVHASCTAPSAPADPATDDRAYLVNLLNAHHNATSAERVKALRDAIDRLATSPNFTGANHVVC